MNKQLAHIDAGTVRTKIDSGQPITLAELAVFTSYAYSEVRTWRWLPLVGGRLFWDDFILARRIRSGLLPDPRIAANRPKSTAGKSAKHLC